MPPTTQAECEAAAADAGLSQGGAGYDFVGDYSTGGCYTYDDPHSQYFGVAYWSTSGTEPASPTMRVCMSAAAPALASSTALGECDAAASQPASSTQLQSDTCPWVRRPSTRAHGTEPWTTDTANLLQCMDGSYCDGATDGWGCCADNGGRARCPPNYPHMCNTPNQCGDGTAHCCEWDCDISSPGTLWGEENPGGGQMCEGDCDDDSECNGNLVCWQRDSTSEVVPGCGSGGRHTSSAWDYCTSTR